MRREMSLKEWIKTFSSQHSSFPKLDLYFLGDGVGESIIIKLGEQYSAIVDAYGTKTHSNTTKLTQLLDIKKSIIF